VTPDTQADEPTSLQAAVAGDCPRCRACGLDFGSFNVGGGAAAFLISIVGTITVVAALVVDGAFSPPWWVHLVWIPVAAVLTIRGLRVSKTWLLAQEYKHRAREGRIVE
jgi:uncharacterized protein (DUF983 family)